MGKLLSISVAAYNVEKTLAETLKSFECEKIMDSIEVFIVNDGSTDNTIKIAKTYVERYPNTFYIIDKENGGHGSTINASLFRATGKYFKIVDGDDWVFTDNLSSFISELSNTNADIVATSFVEYYENTSESKLIDNSLYGDKVTRKIEEYIGKRQFAMHEITVKTSILKENNVHITEKCFYVDHEFMQFSIGYAHTLCEIDMPIYKYRLGNAGQSVSPENRKKRIGDQKTVLYDLLEWFEGNHHSLSKEKFINAQNNITNMITYIFESYAFFSSNNYEKAKNELQEIRHRIILEYPSYKFDYYGIAFHLNEKVGLKRKIMFMIQYCLVKTDFSFMRVFLMIKNRKSK